MAGFLSSIGFPDGDLAEFARLCLNTKHEGDIITTSVGTYYRLSMPIPDTEDFEIELWLKQPHEDENYVLNSHFIGATSGKVQLTHGLKRSEGQHYDGAYRFTFNEFSKIGGNIVPTPLVFECPNFDCGENLTLPLIAPISLCGFGAGLRCYADEAEYLEQTKFPPPAYIFADDFIRGDEPCAEPLSPIAHLTGWVEETEIITNPLTNCDFTWAMIDIGNLGLLDIVSAPSGLDGFLHEGGVVTGTVWLSGRLVE